MRIGAQSAETVTLPLCASCVTHRRDRRPGCSPKQDAQHSRIKQVSETHDAGDDDASMPACVARERRVREQRQSRECVASLALILVNPGAAGTAVEAALLGATDMVGRRGEGKG